mmetsp:Transcript_31129/g.45711  ORF Transcript_31129/g.45711 Transcript_31129/m.45711 type:complete len:517 (-) Transcript_31129:46-1596(-)
MVAEAKSDTVADAAAWDLTSSVSPYLDLHMMFPLLEYVDSLISSGLVPYAAQDVAAARLSLLRPTHMVDYAMDIYRELHGMEVDIPAEMEEQKAAVFVRLEELRAGCRAFDELCQNQEERANLTDNGKWNITSLSQIKTYEVTPDVVETYRQLAKFNFDCGDYQTARDMLENYLSLFASPPKPSDNDDDDDGINDKDQNKGDTDGAGTGNAAMYYLTSINKDLLQVLWGKLSCEILVENWEEASVALTAVKTAINSLSSANKMSALEALQQRTWLLHWSLFVFWNSASKGLESMVELFTTEKYLQAITTNAPHLLRYLTAAVLLCKRRVTKKAGSSSTAEARRLMKDLVKVMQHCEYTDPIVEFVDCLCVKFDFESAQTKLAECEHVLATDFFLCKQTALFMEEARVFVFENYCRIHHKIDLSALGEKLAMDQDQAERWIVDLIRNALLDAKIDSEERCVVMGADSQSVYEQVMERTRDLNVRSGTLAQNLATVLKEAKKEKARKVRAALEEDDEY